MSEHTNTTASRETFLRAVGVLGLIALLVLGAWGIIQLAFGLPGFMGNLFEKAATNTPVAAVDDKSQKMSVKTPSSVESSAPFTVAWTHEYIKGPTYSYTLSYSCMNGVSVKAPVPTGAMKDVPCETPFNYTSATQRLDLTAMNTSGVGTPVTITVAAHDLATGATTVQNTATVTINPGKTKSVTSTAKKSASKATPSGKYIAASRIANLYGSADLAVRIISAVPQGGSRYSVQFEVVNVGTNVTPSNWTFNAILPVYPAYTYTSNGQQALYPGDKMVYTLGFDMTQNNGYYTPTYYGSNYNNCTYSPNYTYNGVYNYPTNNYGTNCTYNQYSAGISNNRMMTINVDPQNYMMECNKGNNTTSITL